MNFNYSLVFVLVLWGGICHAQSISVANDSRPSGRRGFFNWSVYLRAPADTLKEIKEVTYTLHPTFRNPEQLVKASPDNRNFSYKASGWGEFDIKVKVIFNRRRNPLYLIHHLKLNSR
ncbi:MAG TPA: pYEATS domain-containing protein [Flavisolibacter sp.]|nr:pYEATS domain-containing protein [Flavisolibacter sp.]